MTDWIDISKRTWVFRYWMAFNILDKFESPYLEYSSSFHDHPYYVEEYEMNNWGPVFRCYLERREKCLEDSA